MSYWQVEARTDIGTAMTLGLTAPDPDQATELALERLLFTPYWIILKELPRVA